ncbi:hypothetical protein Dip518_000325 [Parelusimicrobium proximum]|uniref:hypothetical protein n=1 Tax=Parelusimicrobium proximum TaxID=3228953 RepID=UPI003D1834E5
MRYILKLIFAVSVLILAVCPACKAELIFAKHTGSYKNLLSKISETEQISERPYVAEIYLTTKAEAVYEGTDAVFSGEKEIITKCEGVIISSRQILAPKECMLSGGDSKRERIEGSNGIIEVTNKVKSKSSVYSVKAGEREYIIQEDAAVKESGDYISITLNAPQEYFQINKVLLFSPKDLAKDIEKFNERGFSYGFGSGRKVVIADNDISEEKGNYVKVQGSGYQVTGAPLVTDDGAVMGFNIYKEYGGEKNHFKYPLIRVVSLEDVKPVL